MTPTVVAANAGRTILDGFVVFKLFGTDTGGGFSALEHRLDPGTLAAPVHTHRNEDEYSYVLEGEIIALIGDELIHARAGTLVCKPRNIPHTFWNPGDTPARLLEIISPAGFERYFDDLSELLGSDGQPSIERIQSLAQKYNVQMDFSSVMELVQKYNLSVGGPRAS
jgi:quercetin dioxygenase-like cupin family protein